MSRLETDFNHVTDAALRGSFHETWDRLREEQRVLAVKPGPSAHALPDPDHTTWYLLRYEDVYEGYRSPRLFSSVGAQCGPDYRLIPSDCDPPEHGKYRRLLNPPLSRARVAELEPVIRRHCRALIAEVVGAGECDFVPEVAYRYAPAVFMRVLGLPEENEEQFLDWTERAKFGRKSATLEDVRDAVKVVIDYFLELIRERRACPRDDLISHLVQSDVDGVPLDDGEIAMLCRTLFGAGLDTTASACSYMIAHLARHPEQQRQLRDDPTLVATAAEELLRTYSLVANERLVRDDVEFAGCPMRRGDRIVLSTMAANRDPREFADAETVDFSRKTIPHLAFGAGPHRCVGAHLARLELQVLLDEWHRSLPEYRLADGAVFEHFTGAAARLKSLPLVW